MFDILKKAALAAAEIQLKYFRADSLSVKNKTDHKNLVTEADKMSQKIIEETIIEEMNKRDISSIDIGFMGEEDLVKKGKHLFIIDPIDGTANFASGLDYFCSSVAYINNGVLTCGMIYRPFTKELYYAEKGCGAIKILDGKQTKLGLQKKDKKNYVICVEAWESFDEPQIKIANKLLPLYRCVRSNGSIALDLIQVAENICGVVLTEGPVIWDIAAAKLIVEESGKGLYNWSGEALSLDITDRKKTFQILSCRLDEKDELVGYIQDLGFGK